MTSSRTCIIIGAGLSGLCAARTLRRGGVHAEIYEASDGIGGRVRTDRLDGFLLDRGFQVMLTAYPALLEEIDLDELVPMAFDPGARIHWQNKFHNLSDPFRRPQTLLAAMRSPLFGMSDKLKTAALRLKLMAMSVEEIFEMPDSSLETFLREFGFSGDFLDHFIRPFYGGIFLERELSTSARMFAFVFKMLSEGETVLPAKGMGELSNQIALELPAETIHLNSPVGEIIRSDGRVTGIRLEKDDSVISADAVIVATDATTAAKLTGLPIPTEHRASTCLYFSVPEAFYSERLILLFTEPESLINNAALVTNVAPTYAPPGKFLFSATVLGEPGLSDSELVTAVLREMSLKLPEARVSEWEFLRLYRVDWAQFAQPAGIFDRLPTLETGVAGLRLAGEITQSSSLHGALLSGRLAAYSLLSQWE